MNALPRPALLGGPPVRPEGPPSWPFPDPAIEEALTAACRSGAWGQYHGGLVERLEATLAEQHQVAHALTCGSGTFAVELALRALKVGPGDEVILSAYDYPGNFLTIHALGAIPVLIDVAPHNWNLAPEHIEAAWSPATRVLLVSHLHGGVVPMRAVMECAARLGLKVLEDAAQCPGARVEGRRAGTWGDVGVLSFGGSKLLSAGRGGALLTRQTAIYQRARVVQHRGNLVCPLSELQAAVLLPQLAQLDARNAWRHAQVEQLRQLLADLPGIRLLRNLAADSEPAYYKVGFQLDVETFGLARARLVAAARAEGIALDEGFRALHVGRSPSRFRRGGPLNEAERAHHGTLILHHPILLLAPEEVAQVALALRKIYTHRQELQVPSAKED